MEEINTHYEVFYKSSNNQKKIESLDRIIEIIEEGWSERYDLNYEVAKALGRKWILLDENSQSGTAESSVSEEKDRVEKKIRLTLSKVEVLEREYTFSELIKLVEILDAGN